MKYKGVDLPTIKADFLETLPIEKYKEKDCLYVGTKYGNESGVCGGVICEHCLFDEFNRGAMFDYLVEKGIMDKVVRLKIELDGVLPWLR